jgi:hypothetical protein
LTGRTGRKKDRELTGRVGTPIGFFKKLVIRTYMYVFCEQYEYDESKSFYNCLQKIIKILWRFVNIDMMRFCIQYIQRGTSLQ